MSTQTSSTKPTRTLSSELKNNIDKIVTVRGWLYKIRKMGGISFLVIRDRKGLIQAIIDNKEEIEKLTGLYNGTVLSVTGKVKSEPRAPGEAEMFQCQITVDVPVKYNPPVEIDKNFEHKSETLDTLFENKVIMLRNIKEQAIFRIQADVKEAVRQYLKSQEFVEFNSPKLLPGATEGGAEVFKLDYFGQEATLAQSAQFYKQIMVGVFERAFEINPTYRAEPSATTRHMTEFLHIDAEMGFIELQDLMDLLSGLLNSVSEYVWKTSEKELLMWKAEKPKLTPQVPAIKMEEIHKLYSDATGENTIGEKDLRPDEERWICKYASENLGSEAVFVTHWPASEMKFYHHAYENEPQYAERIDLLFRGVEIATGSMREYRYDVIMDQLQKIGADPEHPGFRYYLQAFKYGMPPHGGFGMGFERLVQKLIGLGNVKEASLFPRDMNRLAP
ncbi:MAG: aspartate--tRNA(Asn) ligase [Patescibacteria group bacterium]